MSSENNGWTLKQFEDVSTLQIRYGSRAWEEKMAAKKASLNQTYAPDNNKAQASLFPNARLTILGLG